MSLLRDKTCSVLVVPKGLKQGELRVHTRHLTVEK
jgi:hypothetical protein